MGKKKKRKKKPLRPPVSGNRNTAPAREKPDLGKASRKPRAVAAAFGVEARSVWTPLLIGLLIFLIVSPPIVGPYGQKGGYTPDLHMAAYIQVGGLAVLSLFLLSCFVRRQIVMPRSPVQLPILVFYGWAMLSVLWAHTKYEAVVDALDWSGAFLCALLIMVILREVKVLRVMLFFLLVSGLLMALLGIGQYLFGIDWVQQHIVPAATFSNKNMAGQYGVLTLPIAVSFFLLSRNNTRIWFFSIVIALIMTYILYTRSRGALVGLISEIMVLTGLLVYLKLKHDYHILGDMPIKKIALAVSLALFVGMSFLTPSMFGNTEKVLEASIGAKPKILEARHGLEVVKKVGDFSGSANTRITMWGNSIPMFMDHFLIGTGLGNWTIHHRMYQSWFRPDSQLLQNLYHANAHNDYIEILCELGIIGFALFIWMVVSLFRLVGRLLTVRTEHSLLAIPAILAIAGIGVNAVFSFPLKQPVPIFIVMTYIAVLSNLYGVVFETGRDHVLQLPALPFRAIAAVVAIAVTLGLFSLQHNWYHSELDLRSALISMKGKKFRSAYNSAKRAHQLNPLRNNLLWMQATALMQMGNDRHNDTIIEMLKKVDRARPYDTSTLSNLSVAYRNAGRYQDEADAIGRLVSVQPNIGAFQYRLGVALAKAGRIEEALERSKLARSRFEIFYRQGVYELEILERKGPDASPDEEEEIEWLRESLGHRKTKMMAAERLIRQLELKIKKQKESTATAAEGVPKTTPAGSP